MRIYSRISMSTSSLLLCLFASASSFLTHHSNIGAHRQSHRAILGCSFGKMKRSTCFSSLKMMETIECDVAIVGGGPAGCTCALYTSRADLKTVILDKNPHVGALAITSHIANYPGVDKAMTGEELLDQMRQQAIDYGTDYRRAQVFMIEVEEGDGKKYSKTIYTPEATVKARSLILATGAMGRSSAPFPGEEEFLGQGVSYCATCDGAFYRDSEVAVFGVSVEAMEEALFLTKFASTVHWITPTSPWTDDDEHVKDLLAKDNVKHWSKTKFISVEGEPSGVTGMKVKQIEEEEEEVIPVEGVFIYALGGGSKPITDFIQNQVELNEDGGVKVNEDMEASVKGVYAIGDVRNTPYKQVVVAASDGCIAAMSIDKYLKGRKSVKVDWIHK
mmetsp:Transcript_4569/g.6584  ORF Transcript_4569/g.6584 Transcript_4569/m.6584 type:complete len:389 (-) Transcript_4569:260-1426(-)